MLAFGFSEDEAREWLADGGGEQPEVFGIWPCNSQAWGLFMDLKTQWRPRPFGGVCGLDYTALPAVMALRGIRRKARGRLFDAIQVMESAVLEVFSAQ